MASYQAEFTADHGFLGLQHGQTVNVHKYEGDRHAIIGLATIDGPFQDGIWDFIKIKAERFGRVAVSVAYLSNGATVKTISINNGTVEGDVNLS